MELYIGIHTGKQKKSAKFADHTNELVWETLAQRGKIARICTLFKAYTGEWAWKASGDMLQGPCYLNREDHDQKIRSRAQRTYWVIFFCK